MTSWRLIPLLDGPGSMQMAIDSWLLQQYQQGHPPTLRFYTWTPAALSLGFSQRKRIPPHWHSLHWQGNPIDLVQRPSGGRGVLHQGDLTYALVTDRPSLNRQVSYQALCQFLIVGWAQFGVHLNFGKPYRPYMGSSNCFELATTADLVDEFGNKFIGSAQYYQQERVLQHGSMLLKPDIQLFHQAFGKKPPTVPSLSQRLATPPLAEVIGEVIAALIEAAEHCFTAEFQVKPLTSQEWAEIKALAAANAQSIRSEARE